MVGFFPRNPVHGIVVHCCGTPMAGASFCIVVDLGPDRVVNRTPTDGASLAASRSPVTLTRFRFQQQPTVILDHIGLSVSDYARSKEFFAKALAPLGITLVKEVEGWAGFGRSGIPVFWFGEGEKVQEPMHIAFAAENRDQVRAFHEAALDAGGKDNGPPGVRAIYHPNYFGAFVIGPDGHNIEAVCHGAET